MNWHVHLLPECCSADTGRNLKELRSVTVHWTGPYPEQTPEQVREWWARKDGEASAHLIIKDSEVLQCWPLDKMAWHCGVKEGNETSIGIEIIPMNKEGEFSRLSIKTLAAVLAEKFNSLPVLRHFDWSGKKCPEWYIQNGRWHELLKEVIHG